MECSVHKDNNLVMVCVSCDNKLLCLDCVDEHEEGHTFKSTKVVVSRIKQVLQGTLTENTGKISFLKQKAKDVDDDVKQQEAAEKHEHDQIQKQRQVLHSAVDEIATNESKHISEQKNKNQANLTDTKECLQTQLKDRAKFELDIKAILTNPNDVEIIQKSKSLATPNSLSIPTFSLQPLEFCVGQADKQQLYNIFGRSTGSLEEVEGVSESLGSLHIQPQDSSFSISQNAASDFVGSLHHRHAFSLSSMFECQKDVICIRPSASDNLTWVKWKEMINSLQLIDREGHVMQTVKFPCEVYGNRLKHDNTLLACGTQNKSVYQVQYGSEPTVSFRTPFYPLDILPLDNGDLIVSEVDSVDFSRIVASRRMVSRFNEKGHHKADAEYDMFGDPLFVIPTCLSTNSTNTTIAVINETSQRSSHLVLLDGVLNLKLRLVNIGKIIPGDQKYRYTPDNEKFIVYDVTFDPSDNIIIASGCRRSIFVLNAVCELLYALWEDKAQPSNFCLQRNGEFWCQFRQEDNSRCIKILK